MPGRRGSAVFRRSLVAIEKGRGERQQSKRIKTLFEASELPPQLAMTAVGISFVAEDLHGIDAGGAEGGEEGGGYSYEHDEKDDGT